MLLFKPTNFKRICLVLLLPLLLLSSCFYKSNEDFTSNDEEQQQQIAQILVKSTELNFEVLKYVEVAKGKKLPTEVMNYLVDLNQLVTKFQNNIVVVAEKNLVTIPIYNKPTDIKIENDLLIETIMNQLISQVVQLEKIKNNMDNKSIVELKNSFLPEINSKLEQISTLKIKQYKNN